ncbi:MAG TPA: VCBS repeat domain-containing M23 family metallopeptidase [Nocardioidaceae bacterium]
MLLRRRTPAAVALAVAAGLLATPAAATAAPDQELPFPCSQVWTGTTRANHSPSSMAIDFNRPNDLGDLTVASATGVVSRVEDTGSKGYGKWIRVDHPEGYSTVYAHLKAQWVVPGQFVDQGSVIGRVGASGGVTGAHLHYEQRLGRDVVPAYFHQARFVYGTASASQNCPDVPLAGDWDGNGTDEVGVFRRGPGRASFHLRAEDGTSTSALLGRPTDLPVVGDWDGDGRTDVGVRRAGSRIFLLRSGDGTITRPRFGLLKDRPVTGDWDGDGTTDVGVWRPATKRFLLRRPDGTRQVVTFGGWGSQPVTGDWNGDGTTDVGVFDAATATFRLRWTTAEGQTLFSSVLHGSGTDLAVTGDWNGDGTTDVGTWTPSTGAFALRLPTAQTRAVLHGIPR